MRIAITGSISVDNLMKTNECIITHIPDLKEDRRRIRLDVAEISVRYGGVGANIAFGLGCLNGNPLLIGAAGTDFAPYRKWLGNHGVRTEAVSISTRNATAHSFSLVDPDGHRIASFYPGAMTESEQLNLCDIEDGHGRFDAVLVGADNIKAMIRHAAAARRLGRLLIADPSQQLTRMKDVEIREFVTGSQYLITNEYESAMLLEKTGWTESEVLRRAGVQITTLGADGAIIKQAGSPAIFVNAPRLREAETDSTGAGDAFRAGFIAGLQAGLDDVQSVRFGCVMGSIAVESLGAQEYRPIPELIASRFQQAYQYPPPGSLSKLLEEIGRDQS